MFQHKLSVRSILSLSALIVCGQTLGTVYSAAAEGKANATAGSTKHFTGFSHYYHDRFHGRRTASGQAHDKFKFTCAHRTLPFGTHLAVTNKRNGKTCVVTVNDRGPYTPSVCLDLSKAAALKLGFRGGKLPIECKIIEPQVAAAFLKQQELDSNQDPAMIAKEAADMVVASTPAAKADPAAARAALAAAKSELAAAQAELAAAKAELNAARLEALASATTPATAPPPTIMVAARPAAPSAGSPVIVASSPAVPMAKSAPAQRPKSPVEPAPAAISAQVNSPSEPKIPALNESTFLLVINDILEAEVEKTPAARSNAASMNDAVDFERQNSATKKAGKLADIKQDPTL